MKSYGPLNGRPTVTGDWEICSTPVGEAGLWTTLDTAANVADAFGDGVTFCVGHWDLYTVCHYGAREEVIRENGDASWTFRDGSRLASVGGGWDLVRADCTCGWCWKGCPRQCKEGG